MNESLQSSTNLTQLLRYTVYHNQSTANLYIKMVMVLSCIHSLVFVIFFINCADCKLTLNKHSLSRLFSSKLNQIASVTLAMFIPNAIIPNPVNANVIGQFETSGFIFKDTLKLNQFNDPKVEGVALYLADFERPLTDKLQKDFFSDPSSTSLTCSKSGPIVLSNNIVKGPSGEEVFEESRNLFFKSVRVRRIYDEPSKTLIYVSYSTRLNNNGDDNKSRYKSSLCSVHIE